MGKAEVEAVFGPQYVQDALAFERERNKMATNIIFALRARLRADDPSLPHIYDGTAWWEHEQVWGDLLEHIREPYRVPAPPAPMPDGIAQKHPLTGTWSLPHWLKALLRGISLLDEKDCGCG